ncbi:MAG: porin [Calditrichaceae bacterium]
MKNISATVLIIFFIAAILARPNLAQSNTEWNGYLQSRISADPDNYNDIMVRRAKLWLKGNLQQIEHLSYKIQVVYRSFKDTQFMVQDVYAKYETKSHLIQIGRMVPDFTLQRNQPDTQIPVLERAGVIDGLIHGDQSIARMIGIQYKLNTGNVFHLGLGIFNANPNEPGMNKDKSFLYTLRNSYTFSIDNDSEFHLGFSFAYRKLNDLSLPKIYNSTTKVSGDDYRWGFESGLNIRNIEIQGEYLTANINRDRVWGYYGLVSLTISEKYQPTMHIEKYADLNLATDDSEWYRIGLNYFITKKTKIMSDFGTQLSSEKNNYLLRLQLQVFYN